jgi:hypothetical protein
MLARLCRIIPVITFVTLFSMVSCGDNLEPIEGGVIFKITETHPEPPCEPVITLFMETDKIYPHCNNTIAADVSVDRNTILVTLAGIRIPDVFLPAFGPATASAPLPHAEGERTLHFLYSGTWDTYICAVNDSFIKIEPLTATFTEADIDLYWRYPENSFAYLCGTTHETAWIYEDFLDTLLSKVDLTEFQFPDSGSICYPCSTQGHYVDMPARYFLYDTATDFEQARAVLEAYTESIISQYSGVGISLLNWRAEIFASWLF